MNKYTHQDWINIIIMTPKEKAKELVSEFYENVYPNTGVAIEAVKFTVNEILNLDYFSPSGRDYWQEVKNELDNL